MLPGEVTASLSVLIYTALAGFDHLFENAF